LAALKAPEIFREFLKNEKKHRITPERFEVLDAIMEYQGHFGADDLFVVMKNKKSRVSRATVYNTLELLVQCGLLTKRNFGDNMSHYEFTYRKQQHDHLICVDCGRIVEFTSNKLKNIPQDISKDLGFEFSSYSFNIFARCKDPKECKHFREKK
jgi:Fur family transcriptional regulator, ferric uptake regulator